MWNIIFLVTGLLFILLLLIIFFKKETINSKENIFFKYLIIINFIQYLVEIFLQIFVRTMGIDSILVDIFGKIYLVSIFTWFTFFSIYTFIICLNHTDKEKYEKKFKLVRNINLGVLLVGIVLLSTLPFDKFYDGDKMYSYGLAVDLVKMFLGIFMVTWIVLLFKNLKKLKDKKYLPIFLILLMLIANVIIQSIDPSILIVDMVGTLICYAMSFTIENPDLKLLQELANNRKLTETSIEEKSNMLFQVSQEVKGPLTDIILISADIVKNNDLSIVHEEAFKIENISRNVTNVIDKVLNITQVDKQNIKVADSNYNIYTLLKEIIYLAKNKYRNEDKDVEFKYSINRNIPEILNGDALKIKQVICSILFNAFNNTEKGYVDIDVNSMIKDNVCRLIITISDSGKGLELTKINEILKNNDEVSEQDLEKIEALDIDLKLVKKILDLMGGSLLVKSELNEGTTFTIILNQMIVSHRETEIEKIASTLSNKKRVLLIDNNYLELDQYSYELKKNNLEVISTMYGEDCIAKLENGDSFDLILVDDELDNFSATEVLKGIEKLKIKNLKIVIMLEKEKEFMKEKFLRDYKFTDYLLKDNYKEEMQRISEKYL